MFEQIGKDTKIFLYYALVVLVLMWTATQTISAVKIVLPKDPFAPYIALGLFDLGALGWLSAFLGHAKSTQRTIAFYMTFACLAGIVLMVAGALGLIAPKMISLTLTIATLLNVGTIYIYHVSSPANKEQIQAQNLEDLLQDEALAQAKINVEREAQKLGALMAGRVTSRIKYRLRLPMTTQEAAQWNDEVIDAETLESAPAPQSRPGFWHYLKSFFTLGASEPQPYAHTTILENSDSDSETNGEDQ